MSVREENVRLVFGLKLRQLRLDKGLSLSEMSRKTGISVSYLNEIEKGKKYPKADKIIALAEAMDVKYDWLVSLSLGKDLASVSDLIQSNILSELPLAMFGIGSGDVLELLSNVPAKLAAFVSTLAEISRNFDIRKEQFYFAVLRSYQEMHDNYFEDIETAVERFAAEVGIGPGVSPDAEQLARILTERFGYVIEEYGSAEQPAFASLRSILVTRNGPRLLINRSLNAEQKAFTLGREIAYQCLGLKVRPLTSSWVEIGSFEQVLNNFKASYFSGALLIHRGRIVAELQDFLSRPTWDGGLLVDMMGKYSATPELFFHRITNLLPRYFGISQLFFLRFDNIAGENKFNLTKEIHLSRLHNPHGTATEFYCRRWVSLTILQDLARVQREGGYEKPLCGAQISRYLNSGNEYLVMSIARPMHPTPNLNTSVSVGLLMNDALRRTVRFLPDPHLHIELVNQTCERCNAPDCRVRMAEPTILRKQQSQQETKQALAELMGG
ncbi:MAG: helix-turn-helix domain-containing protein [Ferruginibacter sp.]|nr:helix-turn-helix domain-containing protein [Cytophagales bacterium]